MISERCKDWNHNFKFFILPLFTLVPYRVKIRVPFMFSFLKCHENFCYLWGPYTYLKASRGRHYWNFNFLQKGHTLLAIKLDKYILVLDYNFNFYDQNQMLSMNWNFPYNYGHSNIPSVFSMWVRSKSE